MTEAVKDFVLQVTPVALTVLKLLALFEVELFALLIVPIYVLVVVVVTLVVVVGCWLNQSLLFVKRTNNRCNLCSVPCAGHVFGFVKYVMTSLNQFRSFRLIRIGVSSTGTHCDVSKCLCLGVVAHLGCGELQMAPCNAQF